MESLTERFVMAGTLVFATNGENYFRNKLRTSNAERFVMGWNHDKIRNV